MKHWKQWRRRCLSRGFVNFDGIAPEDMYESEMGLIPKKWRVGD